MKILFNILCLFSLHELPVTFTMRLHVMQDYLLNIFSFYSPLTGISLQALSTTSTYSDRIRVTQHVSMILLGLLSTAPPTTYIRVMLKQGKSVMGLWRRDGMELMSIFPIIQWPLIPEWPNTTGRAALMLFRLMPRPLQNQGSVISFLDDPFTLLHLMELRSRRHSLPLWFLDVYCYSQ